MIASSDPLSRRGCSRSASSTDCKYAYVGLTCGKPRRASVSNASRRHSWIIRVRQTAHYQRCLSNERILSHLRRGVTRFAIPRESISHNGSEKKNGNAGGDSMHTDKAQQLQRTCAWTSRRIAGEIAPIPRRERREIQDETLWGDDPIAVNWAATGTNTLCLVEKQDTSRGFIRPHQIR